MINDRIRRARVLRGLSLEDLAQRLGDISKQALNKFEKGGAVPNSARLPRPPTSPPSSSSRDALPALRAPICQCCCG